MLAQWQIELREKFNLNWPIYDGKSLTRFPSPALRSDQCEVSRADWHKDSCVISSDPLCRASGSRN